MNRKIVKRVSVLATAVVIFLAACRKKDAILPDNLVNFETNAIGITAVENTATVKLKTTAGVGQNIAVVVKLTSTNAVYAADYTTVPAASASGEIILTIPSGNNEVSFTINKVAGTLYDGDEKIAADIYSSAAPLFIGASKQLTLSFAELISTSNTAVVNGGGVSYPNKVFIDLSASRQTGVVRTSWDLNFYTGADDFRVLLNSSVNMMAKQINKTDLTTVTAADTIGFANEVSFSQTAPLVSQLPYIDYPDGDLTKTAIAAISATAGDNKVYIINRGNGVGTSAPVRGWKKIRIIRNATGGYTLQYADIAATTFSSIDISKDDAVFFKSVSFENGAVTVEPQKKKWDIAWTYFANATNFGNGEVPYLFQDIIIINRNVQVAKVLTATKAFADFTDADIAAQTFLTTQNAIAADWRSGGGPTSAPAVRTDRFYIIKDADNNYYKIRFTALTQNSERGYPAYETMLIKKG
jgi:HmuY protein